ncbi:EDD domain protein, DegV family [Gemella bergeri ATCC 700627]|uniref:EDD domain protein, DegV family n=1 Tax=Gemella bergeri ATCC 700627 TaxID=1321820 RepID=U2S1M9_9BACL|nr:DegV family protein [Gemella bergeri]ERK59648.1 EDD domain protein, DegV family [Gemella bergeri ATCC 700627]
MKTAFLCDSTLQVSEEFTKNYPLTIIPLEVRLDNRVYEDNVTIKSEQFYEYIKKGMKPSTSQPSVGKVLEVLNTLKEKDYKRVVIFSISEKLSGTFSSFTQAKALIKDLEIKIIDTKQVARIAGRAIEKIIKDFSNNLISYNNIEEEYNKLLKKQNVLVTVETMDFLYAGGRLGKTQFILSNMLNILPIITIKDGALLVSGKQRGIKKVIKKMCEEIKEKNPQSLIIFHTNNNDLLEKTQNIIKEILGEIKTEIITVSPVIGAHAGPRAIAIGYLEYED